MIKELNVDLTPVIFKIELVARLGASGMFTGEYSSRFKGRGLDFEGYREYMPEDDAQNIDWKASLRSDEVLVKIFKEERNIDVIYLFDVSASMCFSSTDKLKCEYAAEMISSIAYANISAGDSVGLLMFSDDIKAYLPPNQGSAQYFKLTQFLKNPKNYDGLFNFDKAVDFLLGHYTTNSIIILVSDFIGLPQGWEKRMSALAYKNEVIALMIRDPRDDYMPPENMEVFVGDPFSPKQFLINPVWLNDAYNGEAKVQKNRIKSELKKRGVDLFETSTDKPYATAVRNFFFMRTRK